MVMIEKTSDTGPILDITKKVLSIPFRNGFILLFVILQDLIKPIILNVSQAGSIEIIKIYLITFCVTCVLAFFVYKNNTIAISLFTIMLFILGVIGIFQNIRYTQEIDFDIRALFMMLSIYYVAASIVMSVRLRDRRQLAKNK